MVPSLSKGSLSVCQYGLQNRILLSLLSNKSQLGHRRTEVGGGEIRQISKLVRFQIGESGGSYYQGSIRDKEKKGSGRAKGFKSRCRWAYPCLGISHDEQSDGSSSCNRERQIGGNRYTFSTVVCEQQNSICNKEIRASSLIIVR